MKSWPPPSIATSRTRSGWSGSPGLTLGWVSLRHTPPARRRVALVLANYPTRNSRLANGVGLDTPASAALMLAWLQEAGYSLEEVPQETGRPGPNASGPLPRDGEELIQRLLAGRSNDPESGHRGALDHLPLAVYQRWYETLPAQGRERLERVWGPPQADGGLEPTETGPGFPIRGLRFGRVCLLIQPSRGYERDPSLSYHSPDLPPTHAYLAQYLWIRGPFAAQVVVHVGKHGNLEWLPGKGLGLSRSVLSGVGSGSHAPSLPLHRQRPRRGQSGQAEVPGRDPGSPHPTPGPGRPAWTDAGAGGSVG
jgi:cobaltochelatase CobN